MKDFKDAMSKRTNEELLRIVSTEKADYQPLAIIAAEEEITNRNLNPTMVTQLNNTIIEEWEFQRAFDLKKAGKQTRLYGFAVDIIATVMITAIVLFPLSDSIQNTIGMLTFVVIYLFYNIILEAKFQKTLGKFVAKTRVVTIENKKPALITIIRRTICRIIPFDQFSYLFTVNGFHDRLSATAVMKD